MFAVVQYGNQQYKVSAGQKVKIDKIETEEGKSFKTDQILLVSDKSVEIGTPFVSGYIVEAKVLKQGKLPKILVFKKKPKKRYERTQGHRQQFTEIEITSIGKGTASKATEEKKKVEKAKAPAKKKEETTEE